ncbi:MAG TPA: T9SS type A sorting domain-containing protein [Chitinophagaceae bacterium]|nr:T9SS type A sorting domain-containing protein [Chitinophagaceae bacterium]
MKFNSFNNLFILLRFLIKNTLVITVLFFLLFSSLFSAAQSRIYLSTDDHTDYMWTADEATYDTAFATMLDSWMAINDSTSSFPSDYQTKFNCDGSYWVWAYKKLRSASQFQKLIDQIKAEKIVVPMNPLVIAYGCAPAEATIRSMYYAGQLQRTYGIPVETALSMEDQTLPLGLASLWNGSGVKYSWKGICNCGTQIPTLDDSREKEIYWYKGLDDSSVLMKWYNFTAPYSLGGYAEARLTSNSLSDLVDKVNTSSYNYNIAGAFGYGGDDLETTTNQLSSFAEANSNSSTRIIVSNELDFFRDFKLNYGSSLPSLTQSYGNEWEDACASLPQVSSNVKRSLEKMRSAEAMATIVARTNPGFASQLDSMRQLAWMSLGLYWEHDFSGNGPHVTNDERLAWQRRMQQNFSNYVDQLYTLAKTNLGNQIKDSTSNQRFFVFNPLSWSRTNYADYPYSGSTPIHVIDVTTNTEAKSQIISINGTQYLRILAQDVPSVGYKVFEIRNGAGSTYPDAATVNNSTQTIDNDFFTIVFTNSGVITSLIDKKNGNKELANSSDYSNFINNMNQEGYYAGGSNSYGSFTVENVGPVSLSVRITSTNPINHQTVLTVFKDLPRIEINNEVTQNFGNNFVYTIFSFDTSSIPSPSILHEENGAILKAKKVSDGGDYADQQARYDWLTLNHFAAVNSNGNYGVTLSNEDCYFMQTGGSTTTSLDENTAKLTVLVGGKITGLGLDNEGGDADFNQSYAINTFNTYSPATSMQSALDHQDNFTTGQISNQFGTLPKDAYSFMAISDPDVLLWALKPAEEGMDTRGAIVRAWNFSNTATSPNIIFNDGINVAKNVTHVETDISNASFSNNVLYGNFGKNQMKTYRVQLNTSVALSIGVTSFTGEKADSVNQLNWKIDSGTSLSYFVIQRSPDGNAFTSIDTMYVNGNISYNYNDTHISNDSTYYYRLKLVTVLGSSSYSSTIVIQAALSTYQLLIYPNPAQDELKFNLILDKQARYEVRVIDMTGRTVLQAPPPLFERGGNNFTINTSTLAKGTYTLFIANSENKFVRKFVKN